MVDKLASGLTQIFVDDKRIAHRAGVVRQVHVCDKLDAPVLVAETPAEVSDGDARVYMF